MSRTTPFSHPLLLGFDAVERSLERIGKGGDGYPPYNIERLATRGTDGMENERTIRITLAVAGFTQDDLEITTEDNQLTIRGAQAGEKDRDYLHRGIASRQFQRSFLFADGMQILGAELKNGLLTIDLAKPKLERATRRIAIEIAE